MEHLTHTIRQESLQAYFHSDNQPKFGRQALTIYNFYKDKYPRTFTRNEISRYLNIKINAVCGRINELIKAKWLVEVEKRKDEFSNMNNNAIRWKE